MTPVLIGIIGLIALGLPGWQLARAARLPNPCLAGLLAGAVMLVTLVFALQLAGAKLNSLSVGSGWIVWLITTTAWARRITTGATALPPDRPAPRVELSSLWPWLVALPAILAVVYRTLNNPLFGMDTSLRWGFLAEQMWLRETLAFYPPVSAADFRIYFWPDGIPPLVSSIYFGLYCLVGSVQPEVTGPVTVAQFVLLLGATGSLARHLFSPGASGWAVSLLSATSLAAWASAMGQETGFTALALVGLLLYLPRSAAEETRPAMLAAGCAVAAGALAREYGWSFVALALALGWWRGLSKRGLFCLGGMVALTALPWYGRNFVLSGNPLFNLSTGGLFPVNEAHTALMDVYRQHFTVFRQFQHWPLLVFFGCSAVALTSISAIVRFPRQTLAPFLAIGLVTAVWFTSVPYTAGGLAYSLRVLNPALAVAAAVGGAALAAWLTTRRAKTAGLLVLAALSICSAPHTLVLPLTPKEFTVQSWRDTWFLGDGSALAVRQLHDRDLRTVAGHVGPGRLIALGFNPELTQLGVASSPPWSPDAAIIFDRSRSPQSVWQALGKTGFTHILIYKNALNRVYLEQSPAFDAASTRHLKPVMETQEIVLFAIEG